uniref:Retrotransposon gag domain-containing protein n=1 Tax=Cannabis sativa TaxID=3483 RepID=A0A803Q256_CANSA
MELEKGGESLKDYIQRFFKVAAKTKILSEDARVMALATGLKEMSPMWSDLHLKAANTMNGFLDRADGFIKLEEVITRAKGSKGGKKKSLYSEAPVIKAHRNGKKGG